MRLGDQPTLLSLDDARTLFHEFGHGLHGLLSERDATEGLSGTQVLRDFVELPSQLFEHWMHRARRCWPAMRATSAPASRSRAELVRRLHRGRAQLQPGLRDGALHRQRHRRHGGALAEPDAEPPADLVHIRGRNCWQRLRPARRAWGMNHRLVHFQHLFAGSGYAAAYYVYLWAEVLDADAYEAFREAGDPFDPEVAQRLAQWIYTRGNSVAPQQAFERFRGRAARLEPMLRDKGLI